MQNLSEITQARAYEQKSTFKALKKPQGPKYQNMCKYRHASKKEVKSQRGRTLLKHLQIDQARTCKQKGGRILKGPKTIRSQRGQDLHAKIKLSTFKHLKMQ